MVGELIAGTRHDWILATKVGNKMSDAAERDRLLARPGCCASARRACSRLGTDHIDIYYLHRDYDGLDLEEPLRAIDALLRDGKIRYWGVSNFRGWRIAEVVHGARQLGMPGPVVCQPYYNLLNRQPEVEVLPACLHHGIGVVPYSPIARGVLAAKYAPGAPPAEGTRAGRGDARMMQTEFREESLRAAQTLKAHCETQGRGAGALRHRLGAGAPRGELGDRRARAPSPSGRTTSARSNARSTPPTRRWSTRLVAPGHPSTPGYNDPAYPLPPRRA